MINTEDIEKMDIEELRASFSDLMATIVTEHGDDKEEPKETKEEINAQ
jgi:hypothetical protein